MYKLTDEEISKQKEEICNLLLSTNRKGMEDLFDSLTPAGFFTEQSLGYTTHHKWVGGLSQHSLGTYKEALKLIEEQHITNIPQDSLIIACLFHDLCKLHRFRPDASKDYPKSHGFVSLLKLQRVNFEMTKEEEKTIYNHIHHDSLSTTSLQAIVHCTDRRDVPKGK